MSKTMLIPIKGAGDISVLVAKLVTLHGFRFAIHRPIRDGKPVSWIGWNVSEYTTGGLVCSGSNGFSLNTIRDAEAALRGRFKESDIARLTALMAPCRKLNQ